MKKIYISENYLIIDNDGDFTEFPLSGSVYASTGTGYAIKRASQQYIIETDDIPNWYDFKGVTAYTELTFLSLLRINTGK